MNRMLNVVVSVVNWCRSLFKRPTVYETYRPLTARQHRKREAHNLILHRQAMRQFCQLEDIREQHEAERERRRRDRVDEWRFGKHKEQQP